MSKPPLLQLSSVTMEFVGVKALDSVDLDIYAGEVCALIGENGSGKSTLIKIMSGLYQPTEGDLFFDGSRIEQLQPIDAIRAGVQVIYQDFSLFPNLTAAENIAFGSTIASGNPIFSRRRARQIATEALERLGVTLDLDAPAGDLRMVDRQLIAIAAALVSEARLIVMDEPTTALSRREVDSLLNIVQGLKSAGVSVIFVSHKLDEVSAISDRNIVIRNGRIVADQPAEGANRAALIRAMTGRDVEQGTSHPSPVEVDGTPLLKLENLGRHGAFEDISFDLHAGEILGITGLIGSGRDSLALALFGLLPATDGTVYIDGEPRVITSVQDALASSIGFVPEDRLTQGLFLNDSINDNITIRTLSDLTGRLGLLSRSKMRSTARHWVERLSIKTPDSRHSVSTLSGGNQQRVVLAKWLSSHPKILILNGPTVGVDVGSKAQIHELLRDLAATGMGILIVSDDVTELLDTCHRVGIMREGRLTDLLDRADISESQVNDKLVA